MKMEGIMQCYRDLVVWQEGIDLVTNIYALSKNFPGEENYALCDQMQRAAVSIPANIAEGHARTSRQEFLYFLSICLGSFAELETHLTIANKLKYLAKDRTDNILGQTNLLGKRIRSLQKSLQDKAA